MFLAFLAGCHSTAQLPDAALLDASPAAADTAKVDLESSEVDFDAAESGAPAACGVGEGGALWAGWRMPDPGTRKFDTGTAEVALDPGTGLMWQRRTAPEPLDWEGARQYCDCLVLAGYLPYLPGCRQLAPEARVKQSRRADVRFLRAVIRAERHFIELRLAEL